MIKYVKIVFKMIESRFSIVFVVYKTTKHIWERIMTVAEASQRWGLTENTIIKYLVKGFIYDISIENDQLILPDINKPLIVSENFKSISPNIYREMLKACRDDKYINSKILKIDNDKFNAHIRQLVNEGHLIVESDIRDGTNIGYQITTKGMDFLKSKKVFNFNFDITNNANVNITTNIGLVNIGC